MFRNIWDWIVRQFQSLAQKLEKPSEVAIKVVNAIKAYVYDPTVDLIVRLTQTDIDNRIVDLVRQYLPKILSSMLIGEGIIKDVAKGDLRSLLNIFADYMRKLADGNRGKWWADLAAFLLPIIAGTQVDKPVAFVITQGVFNDKFTIA